MNSTNIMTNIFEIDENWDELSWVDRLRLENTTWSSQDNNQFCPGLSVPPVWDPPFHRYRPVVQRAYRADGKRLRDGGGLGSPLLVDPASHAWVDPLQVIRECIESFCADSQPTICTVCSSDRKKHLAVSPDLRGRKQFHQ